MSPAWPLTCWTVNVLLLLPWSSPVSVTTSLSRCARKTRSIPCCLWCVEQAAVWLGPPPPWCVPWRAKALITPLPPPQLLMINIWSVCVFDKWLCNNVWVGLLLDPDDVRQDIDELFMRWMGVFMASASSACVWAAAPDHISDDWQLMSGCNRVAFVFFGVLTSDRWDLMNSSEGFGLKGTNPESSTGLIWDTIWLTVALNVATLTLCSLLQVLLLDSECSKCQVLHFFNWGSKASNFTQGQTTGRGHAWCRGCVEAEH